MTLSVVATLAAAPSAAIADSSRDQRVDGRHTHRLGQVAAAARTSPADKRESAKAAAEISRYKESIARRLAAAFGGPSVLSATQAQLRGDPGANVLAGPGAAALRGYLDSANKRVLALKGVRANAAVFEAKLWNASMAAKVARGAVPLVAFRPSGEDRQLTEIKAFDHAGRVHTLSAKQTPSVPVLVVDVDGTAINREVFAEVRTTLAKAGVTIGEAPTRIAAKSHRTGALSAAARASAAASYTVIERARLGAHGDQEGVGDAEIYTLVVGVGKDGKPRMETVWMPWLTTDQQLYSPAQPVIDWANYQYDAASLVMMEQDGTNYKNLVMAVVSAIGAIVDFAVPYASGAGTLVANIVNAIIKAIPDEAFTDKDDFADAWYLVTRNGNGLQRGIVRDSWLTLNRHDVVGGVDVAAPLGTAPAVARGYVVESQLTRNQVLDSGEARPVQWTMHGGLRQQWKIQDAGGAVNLVSLDTGKCLAIGEEGAATMAICTGAEDQKWRFSKSGSDVYTVRAIKTGQVLSVQDGATAEGAGLVLADDHNLLSQHWRFIKILK